MKLRFFKRMFINKTIPGLLYDFIDLKTEKKRIFNLCSEELFYLIKQDC